MPRNMSFSITTKQVRNKTKFVTRRLGWWFIRRGDKINAVEKAMGLKKGEKIKRICQIRILKTEPEALLRITHDEVRREGFPDKDPAWFIDMFCSSHKGCEADSIVNRIEFEYIEDK